MALERNDAELLVRFLEITANDPPTPVLTQARASAASVFSLWMMKWAAAELIDTPSTTAPAPAEMTLTPVTIEPVTGTTAEAVTTPPTPAPAP